MFGDKIGEGTFGLVYKGQWRGSPVAVKMLKMQNITERALQEFRKELQILTYVAFFRGVFFIVYFFLAGEGREQ